jgi:hypothetical protein
MGFSSNGAGKLPGVSTVGSFPIAPQQGGWGTPRAGAAWGGRSSFGRRPVTVEQTVEAKNSDGYEHTEGTCEQREAEVARGAEETVRVAEESEVPLSPTVEQLEGELRVVADEADTDYDTQAGELHEAGESVLVRTEWKDDVMAERAERLYMQELILRISYLRRVQRRSCHNWVRLVEPSDVLEGEYYDSCPQCLALCGCTVAEGILFVENQGRLGLWDDSKLQGCRAEIEAGLCCSSKAEEQHGSADTRCG